MSADFAELDRQDTPIGVITVRRRREPTLGIDVYEVKLGDEYLMSSLFTVAEVALADLALAASTGADLDVVVGGLGLGYTARAALAHPPVASVHVVEALDAVVGWHRDHLLPDAALLTDDPRCHLVTGDFFGLLAAGAGFGPGVPDRLHAVLVDIDHSPRHLLDAGHAPFYDGGRAPPAHGPPPSRRRVRVCGPTAHPTPTSSPCSTTCSQRRPPTRSASRTSTPARPRRAPCTSRLTHPAAPGRRPSLVSRRHDRRVASERVVLRDGARVPSLRAVAGHRVPPRRSSSSPPR